MPPLEERLLFPETVTISLCEADGQPVRLAGVLLKIKAFARRKNDFSLQPFITNEYGVATITRAELVAEAKAHYDSGLMDYGDIEECHPSVEIGALSLDAIQKQIEARLNVWTTLLKGEDERWSSLAELIATLRRASNGKVSVKPVAAMWNVEQDEFRCVLETRRL